MAIRENSHLFNLIASVTLLGVLVSAGDAFADESVKQKEKLRQEIGVPGKMEITVEQQKVYHRKFRFEVCPYVGYIPNDPLIAFTVEGAYLSFFLSEIWGVEAVVGFAQQWPTRLLQDLERGQRAEANKQGMVNVGVSRTEQFYSGGIVFHPIYGKFSLFAHKTLHFDMFLAAGAGTHLTSTKTLSRTRSIYESESFYRFNTYLGAGGRFYLNTFLAVRLDVRDFIVIDKVQNPPDEASPEDIQHDLMVSLGLSVLFPFKGE